MEYISSNPDALMRIVWLSCEKIEDLLFYVVELMVFVLFYVYTLMGLVGFDWFAMIGDSISIYLFYLNCMLTVEFGVFWDTLFDAFTGKVTLFVLVTLLEVILFVFVTLIEVTFPLIIGAFGLFYIRLILLLVIPPLSSTI